MSGSPISDVERLDRLRLIRSEGIGPRTFRALVAQHGGAGAALAALPDVARRAGRARLRIATRAEAEREVERLGRLGARLIAADEPDYPRPLLAIDTAPPLIAIRGSAAALARPTVAIVGSRNASAAGGAFTERLAAEFGRAGFVVVSGLARGIDTRAHRASVATGSVAVLAGGLAHVYPNENHPLLERIVDEGGAALSEMPVGWEPRGRDFPRRNRIVSGLSYGVVVVEAARRSGSLITARFALEQGREVFAVPGSPLDARAEGTNDLIRGGATLCGSAEHVLSALEPLIARGLAAEGATPKGWRESPAERYATAGLWDEFDAPMSTTAGPADEDQARDGAVPAGNDERLVALMSMSPVSVDDLARQAELPVRAVLAALVELELTGRIERRGADAVSLVAPRP